MKQSQCKKKNKNKGKGKITRKIKSLFRKKSYKNIISTKIASPKNISSSKSIDYELITDLKSLKNTQFSIIYKNLINLLYENVEPVINDDNIKNYTLKSIMDVKSIRALSNNIITIEQYVNQLDMNNPYKNKDLIKLNKFKKNVNNHYFKIKDNYRASSQARNTAYSSRKK